SVLFRDLHFRHRVARLDLLRVLDPLHHAGWRVRDTAGEVGSACNSRERRADGAARVPDAPYFMTRAAAVAANRRFAAGWLAATEPGGGPPPFGAVGGPR